VCNQSFTLPPPQKSLKKPLDKSPRVWYNKYIRWSEAIPINLIRDSGRDGERTGTRRLAIGLECKYRTKAVAIVKPCTNNRKSHKEAVVCRYRITCLASILQRVFCPLFFLSDRGGRRGPNFVNRRSAQNFTRKFVQFAYCFYPETML
jgi:hypothetical protein